MKNNLIGFAGPVPSWYRNAKVKLQREFDAGKLTEEEFETKLDNLDEQLQDQIDEIKKHP